MHEAYRNWETPNLKYAHTGDQNPKWANMMQSVVLCQFKTHNIANLTRPHAFNQNFKSEL